MAARSAREIINRTKGSERIMADDNEIDKIFTDSIEPFEMIPSDKVWQSLDKDLENQETKKLKSTVVKLRMAVGVILILFGFFVAYHFMSIRTIPDAITDNRIDANKTKNSPEKEFSIPEMKLETNEFTKTENIKNNKTEFKRLL